MAHGYHNPYAFEYENQYYQSQPMSASTSSGSSAYRSANGSDPSSYGSVGSALEQQFNPGQMRSPHGQSYSQPRNSPQYFDNTGGQGYVSPTQIHRQYTYDPNSYDFDGQGSSHNYTAYSRTSLAYNDMGFYDDGSIGAYGDASQNAHEGSTTYSTYEDPQGSRTAGQKNKDGYPCDVPGCDSKGRFLRPTDLARHKRTVHDKKKFPCEYYNKVNHDGYRLCERGGEKGFTRDDHYKDHLRDVHRRQDLPKKVKGTAPESKDARRR